MKYNKLIDYINKDKQSNEFILYIVLFKTLLISYL